VTNNPKDRTPPELGTGPPRCGLRKRIKEGGENGEERTVCAQELPHSTLCTTITKRWGEKEKRQKGNQSGKNQGKGKADISASPGNKRTPSLNHSERKKMGTENDQLFPMSPEIKEKVKGRITDYCGLRGSDLC